MDTLKSVKWVKILVAVVLALAISGGLYASLAGSVAQVPTTDAPATPGEVVATDETPVDDATVEVTTDVPGDDVATPVDGPAQSE